MTAEILCTNQISVFLVFYIKFDAMVETYSKTYISKEIKIHWQDLSFAHKTKTMNRTLTRYHFSIYFFADDYLLTKPWKQYYQRLDLNRCPAAAKQHKQMIHTERLVRRTFGKSVTVHRSPSNKLKRELKIQNEKKTENWNHSFCTGDWPGSVLSFAKKIESHDCPCITF